MPQGAPCAASIHEACFTLFRILTGDDWTQMRYEPAQAGYPLGAFATFQVSWIVIATFLLVNLIVGAVINNYQKVQDIKTAVRLRRTTASGVCGNSFENSTPQLSFEGVTCAACPVTHITPTGVIRAFVRSFPHPTLLADREHFHWCPATATFSEGPREQALSLLGWA